MPYSADHSFPEQSLAFWESFIVVLSGIDVIELHPRHTSQRKEKVIIFGVSL
jgi:hypothetical protein